MGQKDKDILGIGCFAEAMQALEMLQQQGEHILSKEAGNKQATKVIERTIDAYAKAKTEAKKMKKQDAMDRVRQIIMDVTFEDFRKAVNNNTWAWSFTNERNGYTAFLVSVTRTIEFFVLVNMYKIKEKDISGWMEENIDREFEAYGVTIQGVLPNTLRQAGKKGHGKINDSFFISGDKASIVFLGADRYGVAMTVPMQKILSMMHEELCKILPEKIEDLGNIPLKELDKYMEARISLNKYMELTGTKDKKAARATMKEALDRLFDMKFVCRVGDTEYKGRFFEAQATPIRGGIFKMSFTTKYLRYCATTSPAAFHKGMYRINGHNNPYAWGIGQKLWQHFMQTRGRKGNGKLKVANVLLAVPDVPSYEEVMGKDRHWDKKIIEPFERDLDELKRLGVLKSWEYCNARGAVLTKEQLMDGWSYQTWAKLYISYELDLPPQDAHIMKHRNKLEAAKKREEARQKRIDRLVETKTAAKIAKEK